MQRVSATDGVEAILEMQERAWVARLGLHSLSWH